MTASEIRAAIARLPVTHGNLKTLVDAMCAYAADPGFVGVSGIDEVSEHLDAASDACDGCYVVTREEREFV